MKTLWRLFWLGLSLTIVAASAQTIPDDPVVVPDPRESADHDLSFPADI